MRGLLGVGRRHEAVDGLVEVRLHDLLDAVLGHPLRLLPVAVAVVRRRRLPRRSGTS
jgi:hypothetical protein